MTHKVVINGSYGGFDLSQTALVLLGELNGGMDMDEVQGKYLWANESGSNARSCPHLVRTVETLGDLANARDSTNLSVVVISTTSSSMMALSMCRHPRVWCGPRYLVNSLSLLLLLKNL